MTDAKRITIGTIYQYVYVPRSLFSNLYYHYEIITDVNENGIEIFHLYKGIIKKHGEKEFVKFAIGNTNIFNFNRGVRFILDDPLSNQEVKEMRCRINEVRSKHYTPYGLRIKNTYNCVNLVKLIKSGKKPFKILNINMVNLELLRCLVLTRLPM